MQTKKILLFINFSCDLVKKQIFITTKLYFEGMRILVLNKYCPKHPLAGGAERRLAEVMQRIARKGHKIYLVCARYPGCSDEEFFSGMHIHRIGRKGSNNTVLVHLLGNLTLRKFVAQIKPDVILEDISPLPWFSPILTRTPKVIIVHHINSGVFFESQNFLSATAAYLLEKSIGIFYKKERIISISKSTTRKLEWMGINPENIVEIRDGIDFRKFAGKKSERFMEPTVLFLGRLESRKGADLLINTFDYVKKQIPSVSYIIAGNGKERKRLEGLAHGRKGIRFMGFVSEDKKKELLRKSWLIAVPSRAEGYGIAVLEAGCCRTPAVANSVPGLSDSVIPEKTGILTNCREPIEFSESIIALLRDGKKRERLGRNAFAFARLHSWESCAEDTLKVLKEVAGR